MRLAKKFFLSVLNIAVFLFCGQTNCFANNWSAFAVEAGTNKTIENTQKTTNNHSAYKLQDEQGRAVFPLSVVKIKSDLYFLGPDCLWWCLGAKSQPAGEDTLILRQIEAPRSGDLKVSWQEANDFVYLPQKDAIAVIDKSGDIFEYLLSDPSHKHWRIRRANTSKLGPPDPDYVATCEMNEGILLLDPERNQIWFQFDQIPNLHPLLPGVLSWRLKPGDINITDAVSIAYLDGQIFVLKKHGTLSRFGVRRIFGQSSASVPKFIAYPLGQLSFNHPSHFRPSRLYANADGIYIVERENNRILKIYLPAGNTTASIFPQESDLRGLVKAGDGFWVISANHLLYKSKNDEVSYSTKTNTYRLDKRLHGMILPIAGQVLPGHPGVYPGARRLYRYGVHNGLDMFNQPGSKVAVITGTPVRAASAGKVVRVDLNYKDMNYATYNRVIRECFESHQTSPKNADLLRGCQVWIDCGNGLMTKYAHLLSVNNKLRLGAAVKQGDIVGYVGFSGTGENLPGHPHYPHLHFEIWLDGKYLGYGLNPAETASLFEDIFTTRNK